MGGIRAIHSQHTTGDDREAGFLTEWLRTRWFSRPRSRR